METPGLFGEWLKQRRKALDLTQEELSARAACSVFALRKIESGERRPSKQLASLLAAALEIPEEEHPTFIRVARGDLNLERMRIPTSDISPPSISDFLAQYQTSETAPYHTSPEPAFHHLPLPPTPLLGRDSELAALERLFKDDQCRLLTLTGMGGIGKTRLAIEFAARQREMFVDGVHFIPLVSINSAESIVPAIADALEFSFSGPVDLKEQLIQSMLTRMKRSTLLILDNLEHLIVQSPDVVELISEFLQRLPTLKMLTTSRERLNLHGEWTYELHGLPVPPIELADKLDEYSAAVLFIQSAQRIKSDFAFDEQEREEVVQICRLLDGVPLALELAAAWVGVLSCSEIASEIESNMDFLSTSMRDMPDRHRSLRATFDHSWKLLPDLEQDVLSRLSIFRGGFGRTAADNIAGATLPLLASLASKSLVTRTEEGRYELHEVIRQFASIHLEENEMCCSETCDRHSEYFLNLAAEYEGRLKSASQQLAVREMYAELDNMRTAWDWGIRHEKFEQLGRAVRSFGWFYEVSGLIRDGIDELENLIQTLKGKVRDAQMDRVLGTTLIHQGLLYFRRGQFVHAKELYDESIAILRSVGDRALLADALIYDGTITHLNGDYPESKKLLREGLKYTQAVKDKWLAAYGIFNLGYVDSLMGEYQKGYDQMKDAVKMWREIGDPHSISLGLNFLVNTQIKLGHIEEARTSMQESITLCEQTKNRWGMGTAYRYLGLAMMANGQFDEAHVCFQKSLDIFGEYFEGWDIAQTMIYLGDATLISNDLDQSEKIYLEALRIAEEAQSLPLMFDTLGGIAEIHHRRGNFNSALELTQFILKHPSCTQDTRDRAYKILSEIDKLTETGQMGLSQEKILYQSLEELVGILLE
ncbi:MAG TPA: tetratricopeptide repeat protein [Anaerolineales bacterium]|nr:tetratricopeptide repeat protein [Anaerolineales bacterium]